jgi:hypothetical protein
MTPHPFDGSDHDGWCAVTGCARARTDAVHQLPDTHIKRWVDAYAQEHGSRSPSLRRCVVCLEPYVAEQGAPHNTRCRSCEAAGRPIPAWVEAWERSLAIQGRIFRHEETEAETQAETVLKP